MLRRFAAVFVTASQHVSKERARGRNLLLLPFSAQITLAPDYSFTESSQRHIAKFTAFAKDAATAPARFNQSTLSVLLLARAGGEPMCLPEL